MGRPASFVLSKQKDTDVSSDNDTFGRYLHCSDASTFWSASHLSVKPGSQYDARASVASRASYSELVQRQRASLAESDAGVDESSIPASPV